jgi:hypothetical protein
LYASQEGLSWRQTLTSSSGSEPRPPLRPLRSPPLPSSSCSSSVRLQDYRSSSSQRVEPPRNGPLRVGTRARVVLCVRSPTIHEDQHPKQNATFPTRAVHTRVSRDRDRARNQRRTQKSVTAVERTVPLPFLDHLVLFTLPLSLLLVPLLPDLLLLTLVVFPAHDDPTRRRRRVPIWEQDGHLARRGGRRLRIGQQRRRGGRARFSSCAASRRGAAVWIQCECRTRGERRRKVRSAEEFLVAELEQVVLDRTERSRRPGCLHPGSQAQSLISFHRS